MRSVTPGQTHDDSWRNPSPASLKNVPLYTSCVNTWPSSTSWTVEDNVHPYKPEYVPCIVLPPAFRLLERPHHCGRPTKRRRTVLRRTLEHQPSHLPRHERCRLCASLESVWCCILRLSSDGKFR